MPKPARAARPKADRGLTVSRAELLSDGTDRVFRELVHDMLAVSARVQAIRNGLGASLGLTGSQYTILITIEHHQGHPEGVGVNQVAEHLHLSGAFVTLEVNKLVARGLVDKTVNAADRRRVSLRPTDAASQLLLGLTPLQRPVNDALFRQPVARGVPVAEGPDGQGGQQQRQVARPAGLPGEDRRPARPQERLTRQVNHAPEQTAFSVAKA